MIDEDYYVISSSTGLIIVNVYQIFKTVLSCQACCVNCKVSQSNAVK